MRKFFILIWLISHGLYAQVEKNFESSNLTDWEESTPGHWQASSLEPINGLYSLRHAFDNTTSGHDQISLAIPCLRLDQGLTTWRFNLRHSYSPSALNNWAIFLISDLHAEEMYPGGKANGYIVGVNFTGSDDMVKLWRCSQGVINIILTTDFNWQTNMDIDSFAGIEVTRSIDGLWTIKISSLGNFENMTEIGSTLDNEFVFEGYFGIFYKYSSAQDQKLFFDDLSITGTFIEDTIPPLVKEVKIENSKEIKLVFSEPIQNLIQADTINFSIDNGIGYPYKLCKIGSNTVHLFFLKSFEDEKHYQLQITNITDLSGNQINAETADFYYYVIKPFDVVISEIMVDPTPSVGLPELEYIEILNTSDYDINLEGWSLQVGNNIKNIPDVVLTSKEYLILCSSKDSGILTPYGIVAGIDNFPVLVNSGQDIVILDTCQQVISFISYDTDWYHDEFKAEGGWSIEIIDPDFPCIGKENWTASRDNSGGTPGRKNSVFAYNPDYKSPEVWKAYIVHDSIVEVCFDEQFDRQIAIKNDLYYIDNSIGSPYLVEILSPSYTTVRLIYTNTFQVGTLYTLTVNNEFADCAGNEIGNKNSVLFGLPEKADSLDLIINEILFNPNIEGVDFVEIYNRTKKIIDIGDLKIATRDKETQDLESICSLSESPYLVLPEEYLVLTIAPGKVISQYPFSVPDRFLNVTKMPSFPDNRGTAVILDKWFGILDEFGYDEEMHFSMLRNVEGVSLERIHPDRSTDDRTNWHSAAESADFATPGFQNSQYTPDQEFTDPVWVEPEVFSPDNDGYNDIVQVFYNFNEPGFVGTVIVFDSKGRKIRNIMKNELLGTSGSFIWDGQNNAGERASIGIYVFFIEIFNLKGEKKVFKKICVLAIKLN